MRAKLLIQNLWKDNYDWDEVLPSNLIKTWIEIRDDIQDVTSNTQISRHYFTGKDNGEVILHIFVDASQRAYGATPYLCNGNLSSLVIAKNRLAPLKGITLPKLELMAAVIGVRIARQLTDNLEIERTVLWSDSQIVLHWIASSKSFGKFVNNRTKEIKESTRNSEWKYVPTESNPAYLQTRGISATQFKESKLWMHGPSWISDENRWPTLTQQPKQETTLLTTACDIDNTETLGSTSMSGENFE